MNTAKAKQHGASAYKAGEGREPALNQEFTKAACDASSMREVINLLDAYMHGWTIAMLADGATDETMPSVRELAEIERAGA